MKIVSASTSDRLVDALAAVLGSRSRSLLAPTRVVVATKPVGEYLKYQLAERLGALPPMVLRTSAEAEVEVAIASGASPPDPEGERFAVACKILGALEDDALLAEAVMAQVLSYLTAAGATAEAIDRRRATLATALAQLFCIYVGSPPSDFSRPASERSPAGAWQAHLFERVMGSSGDAKGKRPRKERPRRTESDSPPPGSLFFLPDSNTAYVLEGSHDERLGPKTLVVRGAASPADELTWVVKQIWRLLATPDSARDSLEDSHRRLGDIAVLYPAASAARYRALVPAVFYEQGQLPHQLIGQPPLAEQTMRQKLAMLLELPSSGDLTRKRVLDVALDLHVGVVGQAGGAHRYGDDERLTALCEQLGVVRGVGPADLAETYLHQAPIHFEQAIERLATAGVMAEPLASEPASGAVFAPPLGETQLLARFSLLLASLLSDVTFARRHKRPLSVWMTYMRLLASTYLHPQTTAESDVLFSLCERLGDLAQLAAGAKASTVQNAPVSYLCAYELAKTYLLSGDAERKAPAYHSPYFGHGVVVGSLEALAGVPFESCFLVGFERAVFPRRDPVLPLDLRGSAASSSATSEADINSDLAWLGQRLEITSAAGTLSYVTLEARTLGSPTDAVNAADLDPAVIALLKARNAQWESTRADEPEVIVAHPSQRLAPLPLGLLTKPARTNLPTANRLTLAALRRFLEAPHRAWCNVRLSLYDEGPFDPYEGEDETLETPSFKEVGLLTQAIHSIWLGPEGSAEAVPTATAEAIYDALRARLHGPGERTGPWGLFGRAEKTRHLACLAAWRAGLDALDGIDGPGRAPGEARRPHVRQYGRGYGAKLPTKLFAPLCLEVGEQIAGSDGYMVRLSGQTQALTTDGTSWIFALRMPEKGRQGKIQLGRLLLRSFLDHVLLCATNEPNAIGRVAILWPDESTAPTVIPFTPMAPTVANAYLQRLVGDLFGGPHDYLLPCDSIVDWATQERADRALPLGACIERALAKRAYDGNDELTAYVEAQPRLSEAEALSLAARRLDPFLEMYLGKSVQAIVASRRPRPHGHEVGPAEVGAP